jgi:calcium-dependent protein kinase
MKTEKDGFGKQTFIEQQKGNIFDKYEIVTQIGAGGYARCLKVKNKITNQFYACKELQKNKLSDYNSLKREISIMIQLDHPNIIKLYEYYETETFIYLIMELCTGGELFDTIIERTESGKPFTEKEAAVIFKQMMSAINYCHSNKIVHRDLKPENLLLLNKEENSPIKVIDFGMSVIYKDNDCMYERVGTAYYIAPEVLDGFYDEKCDIWSAGIILYILLCGYPPFNGDDDNEIMKNVKTKIFSYPEEEWNSVSEDAKNLINRILVDGNIRPSAQEILNDTWVKNLAPHSKLNIKLNVNSFKNYEGSNKLKKATLTYIASRLNENDIQKLKESFQAIDDNNDGMLSLDEMKKAISLNKGITCSNVEEIFKSIDTDNSGVINYTEFIAASLDKRIYLQEEKLKDAFKLFDIDGSGKISKNEIANILKVELNSEEVDKIFTKYDLNKDGEIDFNEFLNMMKDDSLLK